VPAPRVLHADDSKRMLVLMKLDGALLEPLAAERAVFCHDDCHSGNLLVVPGDGEWRISGLLDSENVVAGDPLLDLAKAHCYDRYASERTLAALVDGYAGLGAGWRELLDLYVVYHWLELWVWWASTGTREPLPAVESA
jgi:hygromycin-B 7''-O-kinase